MIAHNLSPRCPGDSELCAYMEREWNSTPAYLGDKDKGDGIQETKEGRVGFFTRVVRSSRSRVRQPQL
ncbi:MAG: hypothetical protein GWN39_14530 [Thermoplasmata archaeon]|nr:hypothetical protein [Thermoplasmata archaeon]NIS13271.1 hypothetical protein [Thermoplasmata archaeon]NIT78653.1 hypothetical protein [Thermoplasmata archaeon]NIU50221.1 hypothetical protein [Thermoplasmata archaeon]NIV79918.1 hypothetical protein [Thermoplasmata archaeon]